MADILSQEEVDALLSAVSTGEVAIEESKVAPERKKVSLYDFRRPERVSKDQIRALQNLHESFARNFSNTLSGHLRSVVEMNLVSVDQLTYAEFIMSLPNPTSIHIFGMDPLEGRAILEINPTLIFSIVDKLFGGQGQPIETTRELTDIEASVIKKIILEALNDLTRAWENIITFSLTLEQTQTNPQFVQIAVPNDTVILISFELKMPRSSGLVSLCYPFVVLEPIISKISGQPLMTMSRRSRTQENRNLLINHLELSSLNVVAELGRTMLSVGEFIKLQVGDIIRLDKKTTDNIVVTVGGNKKFFARPGVVGKNKAIQIVRAYSEGDED